MVRITLSYHIIETQGMAVFALLVLAGLLRMAYFILVDFMYPVMDCPRPGYSI